MPQKEIYQSKYETLLNVAQLGGWEYNVLTQELSCNQSYFSMLGRLDATMNDWDKYSIKEVWETWLHPDDIARAKNKFADFILNPGADYTQQFRMLHANGHWVVILSRARAIRDEQGDLTGMIIGSHLDITGTQEITESFAITQKEFEKTKRQVIKDNAFLKAVLNSPKDLFVVAIDRNYRYLGFSDSYIGFAKEYLKKEVAIGMNTFDVLPEELKPLAKENYDKALNGESFVVSSNFKALNGKRLHYENKYSPIIDQHGKILGLTLFSNDITLLKEQQEEMRMVDLRYAALFDGAEDAILIADAKSGNLVDVNDKACKLFGYTKMEMVGLHQTKLHPPEALAYVQAKFAEFVKNKEYHFVETDIITSKGLKKPVRISGGAPFRVGKYLFTAAYFHDRSVEKAAVEKALTIQELLSKAEGIAHVGSFEVTIPGGFAVWSDEMFRILDLKPHEVIAHSDIFTKMVLPSHSETYAKWIVTASSIEGESNPIKVPIKTAKGNLKYVIVSGVSYKDKTGSVYKFIGVVKDITKRVATLENLQEQNRKLKEIAWAQSHLVRGPLSDILGLSKIIRGELVSPDEKDKLLTQIHEAAEKLDQVIKEVVNNTSIFEEILEEFE